MDRNLSSERSVSPVSSGGVVLRSLLADLSGVDRSDKEATGPGPDRLLTNSIQCVYQQLLLRHHFSLSFKLSPMLKVVVLHKPNWVR